MVTPVIETRSGNYTTPGLYEKAINNKTVQIEALADPGIPPDYAFNLEFRLLLELLGDTIDSIAGGILRLSGLTISTVFNSVSLSAGSLLYKYYRVVETMSPFISGSMTPGTTYYIYLRIEETRIDGDVDPTLQFTPVTGFSFYTHNEYRFTNTWVLTTSAPTSTDNGITKVIYIKYATISFSSVWNVVHEVPIYDKKLNTLLTSGVINPLLAHLIDYNNPHQVSKSQVGLGNLVNSLQLLVSNLITNNTMTPIDLTHIPSAYSVSQYVSSQLGINSLDTVPVGGIIMYYGILSNLPLNYKICDGTTYGSIITPDLRGRFVVCCGQDQNPLSGDINPNYGLCFAGGANTWMLSAAEAATSIHDHSLSITSQSIADHSHNISGQSDNVNAHYHNNATGLKTTSLTLSSDQPVHWGVGIGTGKTGLAFGHDVYVWNANTVSHDHIIIASPMTSSDNSHSHVLGSANAPIANLSGSHSHLVSGNTNVHAGADASSRHENRPPYYALYYIMRVA